MQAAHEDAFYLQLDCLGRRHPDAAASLAHLAALAARRGDYSTAQVRETCGRDVRERRARETCERDVRERRARETCGRDV